MTEPEFLRTTRAAFDAVAADYAATFSGELAGRPLDRALLGAFAELARARGPIADLGCGPGHVTAHLTGLGADAFGVDLSPGMVEVARQAYPGVRYEIGSMTGLDLPDDGLGGVLAWYSIVNLAAEQLPAVFAEFRRVLAPGGWLLLAFQTGDGSRHATEWFGHPVSLDLYRRPAELVAGLLGQAGFVVSAQLVREPEVGSREKGPRAHLLARVA
ncbi:Methyltransferase domain-containing protein [Modestobacter sp. DSM 44400]|uniref:class I SAM-dependent DNA methyltransferase n=1 Tax=Modestobacter sp. DSM 44400 TaxID=1550230 RepID=UPI000895489E|nr:class I SAM-dependent methyltransferase [Modestobacter sp. DSM 44400]SDX60429.1 Methyltransferase domain-containing protein [Modestobacter sp. DSM 44400]